MLATIEADEDESGGILWADFWLSLPGCILSLEGLDELAKK